MGTPMYWTRERVVESLRAWMEQHGRQPVLNEWRNQPGYPSSRTVVMRCGSWSAAIEAAGGVPLKRGESRSSRDFRRQLARLDARAEEVGCLHGDLIRLALERIVQEDTESLVAGVAGLSPDGRNLGSGYVSRQLGHHNIRLENNAGRPATNGATRKKSLDRSDHEQGTEGRE